jgi:transcriptional regulator with XRE-family HTH domain
MELNAESIRLRTVYYESKDAALVKNTTEFAELLETTQSNISRMMSGEYPLSYIVVKNICHKLGYSPNWFINGDGEPKIKKHGQVGQAIEIQMLRTEVDILASRIKRLEANAGIKIK